MTDRAIAVEIGATVLRLGIVDGGGEILRSERRESANLRDQSTASRVLLQEMEGFAGDLTGYKGIGIAMAGLVDNETRSMTLASNLGWRDFSLGDEIEELTGMRTVVDKDTNMAALGELAAGIGRGLNSFIYATIGTGVGGSVIYEKRLLRGIGNRAGEFGHVYAGGEAVCGCGSRGCLETIAGGAWISRRAQDSPSVSLIHQLARGEITPLTVVRAAEQGDQFALDILAQAAAAVGIALVNAIRMIYPEAVILGGSVGSVGKFIFEPIRDFVEKESILPGTNLPPVRVFPAGLDDSAAMIGAGLSVLK